ncbi:hypothetical protein PQR67_05185 [Paraburkholderia fungorum]|uniref:hypothetical protein n=1 Tax=Paraburkholderia fungorum TaxID=134537 RepID=UPI0038BCD2EA
MSKSTKNQLASRPPVDALQYEKLALSAFHLSDRHRDQLDTLITFASSICRNPAITSEERRHRQTLLELLVDTMEQYQQELECDRELYQVIALDAKGVAHSRITARQAANLLAEASQRAKGPVAAANALERETSPEKHAAELRAEALQEHVVTSH